MIRRLILSFLLVCAALGTFWASVELAWWLALSRFPWWMTLAALLGAAQFVLVAGYLLLAALRTFRRRGAE